MNNHEAYIDRVLDEFIADTQKFDKHYRRELRSYRIKDFYLFEKGDRVSMLLSRVAQINASIQDDQRVEAILVDPEHAIIDVRYTEGIHEWEGKTIGLGVYTDRFVPNVLRSFPRLVAGMGGVAYYSPVTPKDPRPSASRVSEGGLQHLALQYAKVTVGGKTIIDFTDKPHLAE